LVGARVTSAAATMATCGASYGPKQNDPDMSEAEAPYEMVKLVPRMTGLPMTIWASPISP
jgi:hypothetical protein